MDGELIEHFEIIENTKEAQKQFGYRYGTTFCEMSKKDLKALASGKLLALAIEDEYTLFVKLK